ncbi:MAG: VOC family protein [Pirellulaceae bacterium]
MTASQQAVRIRELAPLLYVDDIAACLAFYRDRLGFQRVQSWEPEGKLNWCRLERDGAALMLQQACDEDGPSDARGRGVVFFFHCDDADALHAELQARGLQLDPPRLAFYGMNQLFLTDPAGYELCFQNESSAGS